MSGPRRLSEAIEAKHALHEHAYGVPVARGTVRSCIAGDRCSHMRVVDHRTGQWRDLTGEELLNVTAHMMEAVAIGEAMQIIHGRERGLARARQVLGYDRQEDGSAR